MYLKVFGCSLVGIGILAMMIDGVSAPSVLGNVGLMICGAILLGAGAIQEELGKIGDAIKISKIEK